MYILLALLFWLHNEQFKQLFFCGIYDENPFLDLLQLWKFNLTRFPPCSMVIGKRAQTTDSTGRQEKNVGFKW